MNSEIKSEVFDNSYCIFIDKTDIFAYKNTIEKYKTLYGILGIKI